MNRIWVKALLTINLILNEGFHVLMSRVAIKMVFVLQEIRQNSFKLRLNLTYLLFSTKQMLQREILLIESVQNT